MSKRGKARQDRDPLAPRPAAPPPEPAAPAAPVPDHWALAAAMLVTLFFHLPTLSVPFQYDDLHHLEQNPAIASLANLGRIWTDPNTYSSVPGAAGLYRPLLMTSHAITVAIFGRAPFGFHLVNLCLHLLNVGLVFSLFRRWSADRWVAALAAMFFGLLAANQETVAYAAARSTLLASAFGLGAVLIAEAEPTAKRAAGVGVCLLAALLSKELAAVIVLFLLARDLTVSGRGAFVRRWPYYAAAVVAVAVYTFVRLAMVPALPESYTGRAGYFAGQGRVILYYLEKALVPWRLTIYRGLPVSAGADLDALAWAPIVAAIGAALYYRKRFPVLAFGWLWFMSGFAVTSSIFPLLLTSSLERIYLPSIGLAIIGFAAWRQLFESNRLRAVAAALIGAVILFNGATTFGLYMKWHAPFSLWRRAAEVAPGSATPWLWLGQTEVEAERYRSAKIWLARALRLDPTDAYTQMAIASLLLRTGHAEEARSLWTGALKPDGPREAQQLDALLNLAALELQEGRPEKALARAEEALKDFPDTAEAMLIAGSASSRLGDDERAEKYLARALQLSPGHPIISAELGLVLLRAGDFRRADDLLRNAAAGGADDPEITAALGTIALQRQRVPEARERFTQALGRDKNNYRALLGLTLISAIDGDLAAALGYVDRAVSAEPESPEVHDLRAKILMDMAGKAVGDERARLLAQARPEVEWLSAHGAPERKQQWLGLGGQ